MGQANKSIDVNVPVSTAYNQWTQFQKRTNKKKNKRKKRERKKEK